MIFDFKSFIKTYKEIKSQKQAAPMRPQAGFAENPLQTYIKTIILVYVVENIMDCDWRTVRKHVNIPWLAIVVVFGLIFAAGVTVWAIYNWDDAYVDEFNFPVNKSSVERNWVSLKETGMEIQSAQTKGNSKCIYSLYTKKMHHIILSIVI